MSELRALLLTDVVDSTHVSEVVGDATMAAHWAAHDRAARDLLPVWRGREIDKTDGLLLLFDIAADAVGYALAYHHALAAAGLPFKARAGIHVGAISLRENSAADVALGAKPIEVEGLAKPVAARVMQAAQGGQTLLSGDARLSLGPTPLRVQSHGHWRMHGVSEPIELFEVGRAHAPAPFTPPPDQPKAYRVTRQGNLWLPLREVKHSVPAERDTFVGRDDELQELAHRLDAGARLVSVLGLGGTGKTRLVTRFAWTWLGEYPGGVWFCDLAQARSVDGIVFAVAQGLDVPLGKTDPVVQLAHAIAGRGRCLVILDNFEQVARHAEETLGRWLDRAAQARFVVTTREVLGIVGEQAMALAPLAVKDAATLFHRRAESAKPGFQPSADDLAAIEQLVKVLDGLPLAIELAAARVRVMPPRMLLARMNERFKLLWSHAGRRDRQATLRATFDWSWELLSLPEQAALAQVAVFDGGFTLESAEAVLDLSVTGEAPWAVDIVNSLVDKSFVRQVADDRFDLLESVREYAAEHLRTEGRYPGSGANAAAAAQARHWHHFAGLDERAAVAHRCVEAHNLVRACRRAAAHGDARSAVGAMLGAWAALRLSGPFRVGAELAAEVGAMTSLSVDQQAEAAWVAGCALNLAGDVTQAATRFASGLARACEAGNRHCQARLLLALSGQRAAEGEVGEALANATQASMLAQDLGDLSLQCLTLNGLGVMADHQARFDEARQHFEAALVLARKIGDRRMEGGLLGNLGGIHHSYGRLDEARHLHGLAIALARDVGDRRWEGNAHCNLGLLHHEQGRMADARAEFEVALATAREIGHARLECTVLCNLGIVHEAQGDLGVAQVHYEKSVGLAHEVGDRRAEGQFMGYLGLLRARQGHFDEARETLGTGESLLAAASDQLNLGLLLCSRAEAEHLAGDPVTAHRSWQRAKALAEHTGVGDASELGVSLERLRALLEAPSMH